MSEDVKKDVTERLRKVSIDTMTTEQVDNIGKAIGQRVGQELKMTTEKIAKVLKVYGLDIKLTYIIHPLGENPLEALAKEQAEAAAAEPAPKKAKSKKKEAETAAPEETGTKKTRKRKSSTGD